MRPHSLKCRRQALEFGRFWAPEPGFWNLSEGMQNLCKAPAQFLACSASLPTRAVLVQLAFGKLYIMKFIESF